MNICKKEKERLNRYHLISDGRFSCETVISKHAVDWNLNLYPLWEQNVKFYCRKHKGSISLGWSQHSYCRLFLTLSNCLAKWQQIAFCRLFNDPKKGKSFKPSSWLLEYSQMNRQIKTHDGLLKWDRCWLSQKEETIFVTEETPTDFSSLYKRRWQWQTEWVECM